VSLIVWDYCVGVVLYIGKYVTRYQNCQAKSSWVAEPRWGLAGGKPTLCWPWAQSTRLQRKAHRQECLCYEEAPKESMTAFWFLTLL